MDNYLVQIGLPLVAVAVSLIAFLWEFVVIRRKQLGYRVQMDTPVTGEIESAYPGVLTRIRPDESGPGAELKDLSVVLVRIENDGVTDIDTADYLMPDGPVGLHLHFPQRRVIGMAVTELSDATLGEHLEPGRGIDAREDAGHRVGIIDLPKVPMNRRDHYKIFAILQRISGDDPAPEPVLQGRLRNGRVNKTESRTGLSRTVLAFMTFLVVVIVVQFTLSLFDDGPPAPDCVSGTLTLVGSSAFEPVIRETAAAYRKDCPAANFAFNFESSERGLKDVYEKGAGNPGLIAITDGPATVGYSDLVSRPLAMSVFAVIVHPALNIHDLGQDRIRALYRGEVANWNQIGGPDQPVRVINRPVGSGTRETFQQRLLDGNPVSVVPKYSCRTIQVTDPAELAACEEPLTRDVLKSVADIPGAIGYVAYSEAAHAAGTEIVTIDGHRPNRDEAVAGDYAFWGVEYAHSKGELPYDSLAAAFLRYLTDRAGKDIVRTHGAMPCSEVAQPGACSPQR
ncbi:substrate-binding domain-containing protein [Nocardia sp. BMG51109]|uniref:substrate-binding domain-containing protein n=1 Tax=Nocardia sp. BMG51109 TaxID=1056816 RepID=UPI000466FA6D|nr:substrate-binding domain-containing protein [Nocardia sp. BMG51109]